MDSFKENNSTVTFRQTYDLYYNLENADKNNTQVAEILGFVVEHAVTYGEIGGQCIITDWKQTYDFEKLSSARKTALIGPSRKQKKPTAHDQTSATTTTDEPAVVTTAARVRKADKSKVPCCATPSRA